MSLAKSKIAANVPVSDMKRALEFYGKTLGLKTMQMVPWLAAVMASDDTMLILAQRQFTPNEQDIANFTVKDLRQTIEDLQEKGVVFEDYDLPQLKTVDHIAERDGFMAAFFKDSEGNLLQVNQSPEMN